MKVRFLFASLLILTVKAGVSQPSPEPFKDGDRVVFAGNSITEAGFYETYIWLYYITHFPEKRITVYNGGIGGDVARQIYVRLDDDLLAKKPTVLTINFGMNDSRYFEYWMHKEKTDSVRQDAIDTSRSWFEKMRAQLNEHPELKKIMISSSPYDETVKNGKDPFWGKYKTMEGIIAFQKEAAKKDGWAYVDLFYPMTKMDEAGQKKDSAFTLTGPDRIHPGNAGHLVMAYLFLKAQGLANKPIADVKLDAKAKKLISADNAAVTDITGSGSDLIFTYNASSLPFPIDSVSHSWGNPQKQNEALDVIPFTKEFNAELLTVKGLDNSAKYSLSIDGKVINHFSGAELMKGINLTQYGNTPQYEQARKIAELQLQRKDLEDKIRAFYWVSFNYLLERGWFMKNTDEITDSVMAKAKTDWAIASKKDQYLIMRDKHIRERTVEEMDAMTEKMYALAKPVAHKVEIKKLN